MTTDLSVPWLHHAVVDARPAGRAEPAGCSPGSGSSFRLPGVLSVEAALGECRQAHSRLWQAVWHAAVALPHHRRAKGCPPADKISTLGATAPCSPTTSPMFCQPQGGKAACPDWSAGCSRVTPREQCRSVSRRCRSRRAMSRCCACGWATTWVRTTNRAREVSRWTVDPDLLGSGAGSRMPEQAASRLEITRLLGPGAGGPLATETGPPRGRGRGEHVAEEGDDLITAARNCPTAVLAPPPSAGRPAAGRNTSTARACGSPPPRTSTTPDRAAGPPPC